MAWLTAGWVRRSFRAAREKLRSDATVTNTRKSSNVMVLEGTGQRLARPVHCARITGRVNKYFDY
jgi:hypothetical protein